MPPESGSCDLAALAPTCVILQTVAFANNIGEVPIRRPNRAPPVASKDGPRTNEEIRNLEIQLIDQTGVNVGVTETSVAIKQKIVEIKEIKLRPMIDDHDYDVKMKAMQRFFEEGDKVKITLRYRGREMAHQEIGTKLLDKVKTDTAGYAKVEQDARFEGRQVVMVLAPK